MSAETEKALRTLRNAALIGAGLIMGATPLALWMAWERAELVLGLGTGGAFGLLLCALYAETKASKEGARKASRFRTMEDLDSEFLSELSDMEPFIYHNRLSGDSRFRARMSRLKDKLASSNGKTRRSLTR
jgi:hypothetical protein